VDPIRSKYVLTFASKILRECQKSAIFKYQNPWVKANLEIMKEIYEIALRSAAQDPTFHDITLEVESLFTAFGINNINEIQHTGFLSSYLSNKPNTPAQYMELSHMLSKPKIIPTFKVLSNIMNYTNEFPPRNDGVSPGPTGGNYPGVGVARYGGQPRMPMVPAAG
jgi:hypothetical protein